MTSEAYTLRDIDNRDEDGAPFEFTVSTLAEMIPYVDGALRGDVLGSGVEHIDVAIDYLRRERFDLAEQELRKVGVYIRLEVLEGEEI